MARSRRGIASREIFGGQLGEMSVFFGQLLAPQGIPGPTSQAGTPEIFNRHRTLTGIGNIPSAQAIGAHSANPGTARISPSGLPSGFAAGPSTKASIWLPENYMPLIGYWRAGAVAQTEWRSVVNDGDGNKMGPGTSPSGGDTLTGVNLLNQSVNRVAALFNGSTQFWTTASGRGVYIRDYNWDGNAQQNVQFWWFALLKIVSAPFANPTGTHPVSGLPMYSSGVGRSVFGGGTHFDFNVFQTAGGYRIIKGLTTQASDVLPDATTKFNLICVQYHPSLKDGFAAHRLRYRVNGGSWTQVDESNTGSIQASSTSLLRMAEHDGSTQGRGNFQVLEMGVGAICPADTQFDFLRRYMKWQYGSGVSHI